MHKSFISCRSFSFLLLLLLRNDQGDQTGKNLCFSFLLLLLLPVLWGCGDGARKSDKNPADTLYPEETLTDTLYPEETLTEGIKKEIYTLPTPFEVAVMLEQAKAGYIFDIANPPGNLGKYITEKSKAINLGIYSVDLAYSAIYNQHDQAARFLNCTRVLSDQLGISGVYEADLAGKLKKIGNNKDSLVVFVNRVFDHTDSFLSSQDRHYLAVLVATGTYVEGLYLAAELNVVAMDNTLISTGIMKQKENLDRLLVILEAFRDCPKMQALTTQTRQLTRVFADFGLRAGKPLDHQKAIELCKLVEQVRNGLCSF